MMIEAFLTAIPASIVAGAAWRSAGKARKATATSNGMTAGEMIEETYEGVKELRTQVFTHVQDTRIHV